MALTDDGDFGYRAVLAAMNAALQALVAEGLVQEDEAARMVIPTVGRTGEEFEAPFASGQFSGLVLEQIDIFESEDLIWQDFQRDGDCPAFGASWAAFSRASVLPTLALGLAQGTSVERRQLFIEHMEAGMAARLAAAPEKSRMPLATIVLSSASTGVESPMHRP